MTEPRRIIAGRRTADEWENSVGFFGIGKKKWEEQAKAAQAEAEAQADDVKSALPNSDAEASDRTLAERVNEQQRWENSLRRFVQAESTRMQQEEQKSKDTSDLNVDALKQSAQHSGSSAEPSASTAGEARTSGSAEGKKTVGASSQAANADAAQTGSFTQESAQAPDASAPKRAPQISEYRATSMPADAFETNSSATAVPSSNAVSVSGTASVQSEAGSQKQNVQDALKEFNETKYGTEYKGNTSSVSSHADAAASPSSSAEKESADIKTPNVEDREREKLAAGVVPTDAEEKPAFVPAPGVESKNSNDKKTANADSKSTLESTPQESESASDVKVSAYEKKSPSPEAQATSGLESTPSASKKSDKIEARGQRAPPNILMTVTTLKPWLPRRIAASKLRLRKPLPRRWLYSTRRPWPMRSQPTLPQIKTPRSRTSKKLRVMKKPLRAAPQPHHRMRRQHPLKGTKRRRFSPPRIRCTTS